MNKSILGRFVNKYTGYTAENKPNGKHAQKKWLRTLFYELIRDGCRSSQATHGPSDQNVAARGRSHHRSRELGFMRQQEPGEVGADPRENPSKKTAAADAETNLQLAEPSVGC